MKKHIQGLDALRAIASLVVVFSHIHQLKAESLNFDNSRTWLNAGHLGVVLFFVLSGYLITGLLIKEKASTQTISIKMFYMRRVLRIWPLYYFIIFISAVIYAYKPSVFTLTCCLTILPNFAHIFNMGWLVSPQIWSIGVEEQFYLVWPSFIKFIKSGLLLFLLAVIVGVTLMPHVLLFLIHRSALADGNAAMLVNRFFEGAKFNCMAMGGLLAYIEIFRPRLLTFTKSHILSGSLIVLPFLLWGTGFTIRYFTDELFAVLFCLLIAVVTANNYRLFNNTVINYLGKISYGIYMYHWVIILGFFKFLYPHFSFNSPVVLNLCLYSFSLLGTILTASLSYHYFENYFLRLKTKFERI